MTETLLTQSSRGETTCTARIHTLYPHFTRADRAIADLTISYPTAVASFSSRELGRRCGVSEASVIRFVRKVGYEGLSAFREALLQEVASSKSPVTAPFSPEDSPTDVLSKVVSLCSQALQNVLTVLDVDELARAVEAISAAECVHLFSIGGSMRIAQLSAFKLMRMGYLATAHPDVASQMTQASLAGPTAVAIGISFGGSNKAIVDVLAEAKESGSTTICLTNFAGTPITEISDIKLVTGTPGGLMAANLSPSRVAQLAVLDTIYNLIGPRKGGLQSNEA